MTEGESCLQESDRLEWYEEEPEGVWWWLSKGKSRVKVQ